MAAVRSSRRANACEHTRVSYVCVYVCASALVYVRACVRVCAVGRARVHMWFVHGVMGFMRASCVRALERERRNVL